MRYKIRHKSHALVICSTKQVREPVQTSLYDADTFLRFLLNDNIDKIMLGDFNIDMCKNSTIHVQKLHEFNANKK